MSELFIELFSEEMPPNLQISARIQFQKSLIAELESLKLKFKSCNVYSTPTRLTTFVSGLSDKIKILPSEVKGPKKGVPESVIENFAKSKNISLSDLYEKKLEKELSILQKFKEKRLKLRTN